MKFSLVEFPILEWRWRAVLFPSRSDERKKAGDDSVLGLYVLFGHPPFLNAIKYIWSDTLPVGMTFDVAFYFADKAGRRRERSNAVRVVGDREDAMSLPTIGRLFGNREATRSQAGIAVLTDGDNTNSHAVGDYGEICDPSGRGQAPATAPVIVRSEQLQDDGPRRNTFESGSSCLRAQHRRIIR